MSYMIEGSDDDIQNAVRRIADEQLGRALGELADDSLPWNNKVHQARKRCKKLRGLVRIVRPAFADYKRENDTFRDAARLLSAIRNADTLIETYDALMDHFAGETDRRGFAPIRARLTRDAKVVREEDETTARMERLRCILSEGHGRVADWKINDHGFDAIAGGVRKTYKRARKSMDAAWGDPTDIAMHEWRKRVKYHWYHTRLLGATMPQMMGPHETAAEELSELLGDYHDLAVLEYRLVNAPEGFGSKTDTDAFLALLQQRKEALSGQAFYLGRLLLAERSKALVKRWEGYWKRWHAGDLEPERLVNKA